MADLVPIPGSSQNLRFSSARLVKSSLLSPSPISSSKKTLKNIYLGLESRTSGQVILFLLKVAALEVVRRLSRKRCPALWHALQWLQAIAIPPLKWIQRWGPFKSLARGMEVFSRPLLFLSVATTLSESSKKSENFSSNTGSGVQSEPCLESAATQATSDTRSSDGTSQSGSSNEWLSQLRKELDKQGIAIPERVNENELQRFYIASEGNFSSLFSAVKRTIEWRRTYKFLSPEELETWSHIIFWHGTDAKLRPCLVIRLGLACCSIVPRERPQFTHAIVSQIEYGILNLVPRDDPRVTVLVDCEGLSPLRFPMKMMISCSTLMQDHYPNNLATCLVIRLPPIVRVLAQTVIQVLKPATREKMQIIGGAPDKVLSQFLQSIPSFLGGNCRCLQCYTAPTASVAQKPAAGNAKSSPVEYVSDDDDEYETPFAMISNHLPSSANCQQVVRTTVTGILMMWILLVVLVGMHNKGGLPLFRS